MRIPLVAGALIALLLPAAELDAQSSRVPRDIAPNFLSATVAVANQEETSNAAFMLGANYVRRFGRDPYGIGGTAEWVTGGDQRKAFLGAQLYIWISGGLVLNIGPGVEIADRTVREESDLETTSTESHFVARAGVAYYFQVGDRFRLAPMINSDLVVNGQPIWMFGAIAGFGF